MTIKQSNSYFPHSIAEERVTMEVIWNIRHHMQHQKDITIIVTTENFFVRLKKWLEGEKSIK